MICKRNSNAILFILALSFIWQTQPFLSQGSSIIGNVANVSDKVKKIKDDWKTIPDKGLQLTFKKAEEEGKSPTLTLSELPGFGEIALPQSLTNIFSSLKITELKIFGSKKLLDIQGTSTLFGGPIYLHIYIVKKGLSNKEKSQEISIIKEQIATVTEQTFAEYYAVLELTPKATPTDVKKAYRALALKWHPDKAPSADLVDEYTEKMKEINEAYAQVKDREPSTEADVVTNSQTTADTTSTPLAIEGPANTEPASSYDWTFLIDVPETFQLTNISEVFTPVDFEIKQGTFALSTVKFEDEKAGTIEAGLTFAGEFIAHGELEKMLAMVGSNLNKVILKGLITPKLTGSYLKTTIPGRIKFGDKAETTGLALGIRVIEIAPGVKAGELLMSTGLKVMFPDQAPVLFGTEIAAGPTEASLTGSMAGTLTIPNTQLYIADVAVKSTINYAAAAASGGLLSLSGLGFAGTLGVGSRKVDLALYMAVNALLASGEFTGGLYLKDIVTLFKNRSLDEQFDSALPNIGIDRVKVEIATQDIIFNNNMYESGTLFEGEGVILDSKANLKAHLTPTKLTVNGYLEPVTIGPLTITGAGKDGQFGTEDDGAFLDITIDPKTKDVAKIFNGIIDGQVIFNFGTETASAYTRVELKSNTALIKFDFLLANLFTTKLDAKINLKTPKKSYIDLLMEQSALDKLSIVLKKASSDLLESYGTKARRAIEIRRRRCEGLTPFLETEPYKLAAYAVQKALASMPEGEEQALKAFVNILESNKDAMLEQIIPTLPPDDSIEYAWELLLVNIPSLEKWIEFYKEDPNRMAIIWATKATITELGIPKVQELLAQGVSVDTKDIHGKSLLMLAVERSSNQFVDLFISKGASVNTALSDGTTILMHALHSPIITKKLVNAGVNVKAKDNDGFSVLDHALKKSHPYALAAIVNAGAGGGKTEVVKLVTQRFVKALQNNDADTAKELLNTEYFDVLSHDSAGRTTVIQALYDTSDTIARYKIVTSLLQAGINKDLANLTDTKGVTPLVHAIQINAPDLVESILSYKADPWHKVAEKTPLDYANETQNKTIIDSISKAMKKNPQEQVIQPSNKTIQLRKDLEEQISYVKVYKTWKKPNPFRNTLVTAKREEIDFMGDGKEPLLITAINAQDYIAVQTLLEFNADPNIVWQEKSALTHALDKKSSIKRGYPTTNIDRIIQDLQKTGAIE